MENSRLGLMTYKSVKIQNFQKLSLIETLEFLKIPQLDT